MAYPRTMWRLPRYEATSMQPATCFGPSGDAGLQSSCRRPGTRRIARLVRQHAGFIEMKWHPNRASRRASRSSRCRKSEYGCGIKPCNSPALQNAPRKARRTPLTGTLNMTWQCDTTHGWEWVHHPVVVCFSYAVDLRRLFNLLSSEDRGKSPTRQASQSRFVATESVPKYTV